MSGERKRRLRSRASRWGLVRFQHYRLPRLQTSREIATPESSVYRKRILDRPGNSGSDHCQQRRQYQNDAHLVLPKYKVAIYERSNEGDTLHAYQISKRGNSLRVMAEAVRGKRGARINTISPGIIMTPLARDELTGPRGEGYRRMIAVSPAGRAGGTPDQVASVAALVMGPDGGSSPAAISSWMAA